MSQPLENLSKTLLILIQLGPHTTNAYPNQKPCNPSYHKSINKPKRGLDVHDHLPNLLGRPATRIFPFSINSSSSLLLPSIFRPRSSLRHTTTWISTPSRRRRCYRHSTIGSSLESSSLAWISDRETRAGWIAVQDRESLSSV